MEHLKPIPGSIGAQESRGWRALVLFFLTNALFGGGLYFHAFLYNFYLQGLGHNEGVMGVAAAAISAGGLAALIPAGLAVDRLGVKRTYLLAAFTAAGGLAAGALAEGPIPIYTAAAIAGVGAAGFRVAMGPAIMRLAGPTARARAFSWNTAILVASGAGWTTAAGATSTWLTPLLGGNGVAGLRAALLLGALATLSAAALAPLALRFAPGPRLGSSTAPGPPSRGFQRLALPRGLIPIVLVFGLFWTAGALPLPFFNIYFQRAHGISLERIGFILSAGQILTAVAVFMSGEGAARRGPRRMLLAWMLMFPPVLWALALAQSLAPAVGFYMLQAFALPAVYPLVDQILLERATPEQHGVVSSWRNLAVEGSGLIGATAGGYLLQTASFPGLFGLAGGIAIGASLAGLFLLRAPCRPT